MKLEDFATKISLHDGTLYSIVKDEANNKLILRITLCRWLQEDFREDYDELCDADLIFSGVSEFAGSDLQVKEDEICDAQWSPTDGELIINLCQDAVKPFRYYSLRIKAADAVVREVPSGTILYA